MQQRHVVEVLATLTWVPALAQRIYSCPDTPQYDFEFGATCLILKHGGLGERAPLQVSAVMTLGPADEARLEQLSKPFRERLQNYREAAVQIPGILEPGTAHRFYFLSEEPYWFVHLQDLTAAGTNTEWAAILSLCAEPERFFEWPQAGLLLWPGCVRIAQDQRHDYPAELVRRLALLGLPLDTRNNGPAILAFLAAGGKRPFWSNEGWPIHHIYDGTGAVPGGPQNVLHAASDGAHFTHSAGLVAAHPIAHNLAHHSTLLKWLLRREAFLRFGYDPMHEFSTR